MFWAMMDVIGGRMPVPALNKWLSVYPVMTALAFASSYHVLLPRAIMQARNMTGNRNDDHASDFSESEALGVPENEQRTRRKLQRKRDIRAAKFLRDAASSAAMLTWIIVVAPVMRMHYYFFEHCQTPFDIGESSPEKVPPIFNLGSVGASPVSSVLRALSALLNPRRETHRDGWEVLYAVWGEQWPALEAQTAREVTLLMIGHVWRRLRLVFSGWPWRIAVICDERIPMEERLRVAHEFWNTNECCLDDAFSKKFRKMLTCAADLFSKHVQAFLYAAFAKVVLSTAWVECLFASFTQWLKKSPKGLTVASLAAKHCANSFHRAHTCRARGNIKTKGPRHTGWQTESQKQGRCRPPWIRRRGTKRGPSLWNVKLGESSRNRASQARVAGQAIDARFCTQAFLGVKLDDEADRRRCKTRARRLRAAQRVRDPLSEFLESTAEDAAAPAFEKYCIPEHVVAAELRQRGCQIIIRVT